MVMQSLCDAQRSFPFRIRLSCLLFTSLVARSKTASPTFPFVRMATSPCQSPKSHLILVIRRAGCLVQPAPLKAATSTFFRGHIRPKTFAIPATAISATVSFKILERARYSVLSLRINDTLIDVNATYDCEAQDPKVGSFGDISFKSVPIGNKMDKITLVIPSKWFTLNRRLKIGISGSVGVDDFALTADCTGTPPLQCSDPIEYLFGLPSDFIRIPLKEADYRYSISSSNNTLDVVAYVTQNLSPKVLRYTAVDYPTRDGMQCDVYSNVPPLAVPSIISQCTNGTSIVTMYFQDDSLNGTNMAASDYATTSVPDRCSPLTGGSKTRAYVFKIPCQVPGFCPKPDIIKTKTAYEIAYFNEIDPPLPDDDGMGD